MFTPRVLVLDDDSDFLEGMQTILEEAGCNFIATADTRTIQQKVRSYRPNLLILDVYLEDTNGSEIARLIKDAKDTTSLPILLISNSQNLEEISKQANVKAYLQKPFSSQQLVQTISEII